MKLNKIFMAIAAMAVVGCSSDDLSVVAPEQGQAAEDSRMIELNSNFVLAGVGAEANGTRTHWDQDAETGALVNKFLPIYEIAPDGSKLDALVGFEGTASYPAEAVGLCWIGDGAVGTNVYTNYQFFHFGWLDKGETKADVDNCDPVKLYNGSLYSDITPATGAAIGDEADPETEFTTIAGGKAWDDLNYNSGVYKTYNKSIFGGDYIVYYPFNPDFQEIGTIPAIARTSFEWNCFSSDYTYKSPWLGKATFRYSSPVPIEGGMNAANFSLKNLSTLVRVSVFAASAADITSGDLVDEIVLYSESGKFFKQANLAADKIVAGKEGAELYDLENCEGTKTINTKILTPRPGLKVKSETKAKPYITVLPTTVDDLVVLVHIANGSKGKWARVEMPTTEFKAGNAQVLEVSITKDDYTSDFIAVDQASLEAALKEAEAIATKSNPQKITVIGDITLTSNLTIDKVADRFITIEGGDIIVPEGVTLTLQSLNEMKSKVRVLGTECCTGAAYGGRLDVTGAVADDATILNDITLEPTLARVTPTNSVDINPMVTYEGVAPITIAKGATVKVKGGNVVAKRDVQHKGNIEIAKDAKVTVDANYPTYAGNLNFLGSTVLNDGTIEVMQDGSFNMKNEAGGSVWTDGQRMTNNGTFIHNVDAVVGTAVQHMLGAGEYRCRVDKQKALDDAYVQWTRCNVIEMIDGGIANYDLVNACQHTINGAAKYIDIEVNNPSTATTFGEPTASDGKNIEIGNLTVKAGGSNALTIDYKDKGDAAHTQRQLTVHGNMTVSADTELKESKKVSVTGNLDITKDATLTYAGANKNVQGLNVTGNITVTDATFNAYADNGILIKCKNFSLIKKEKATGAYASFGNRTKGSTDKTMEVKGTISNGKGCTFEMKPATGDELLAWITCYVVEGEGTFAGDPTVVKPE